MPESGTYGSVRGALSNGRPYRDGAIAIPINCSLRTAMGFAKGSTHPTYCPRQRGEGEGPRRFNLNASR